MGFKKKQRGKGRYHNFKDIVKENQSFEKYYKENEIVPHNEWDHFVNILKSDLPASFRLTPNDIEAQLVWKRLEQEYLSKFNESPSDDVAPIYSKLKWYTLGLAWQVSASRKNIRRADDFANFHKILVAETEIGHISRQEAVSMIPVQLLDVQSHHMVLDMCASPGSKTAQIVELLHQTTETSDLPQGIVVANDSDSKRCYLLVHQTKRMRSPNLLILNQDASFMPNIRVPSPRTPPKDGLDGGEEMTYSNMEYDRILCDVPCTGDGTLRKNPLIWSKWNIAQANSINQLQVRILRRGLELLKVGGILVYSTCSLNPVENEAVVSSLLSEAKDSVETVDVGVKLPNLIYKPGMTRWKVMSKDGQFYEIHNQVPPYLTAQMKASCFPPDPQDDVECERILRQLKNSIRISPPDQDTGGFFVTVLRKNKSLPWMRDNLTAGPQRLRYVKDLPFETGYVAPAPRSIPLDSGAQEINVRMEVGGAPETEMSQVVVGQNGTTPTPKRDNYAHKENPFLFIKSRDNKLWNSIREFYRFGPEFPFTNLSYRSEDETVTRKNLYYVHPTVKHVIALNRDRLKIVSTGVRIVTHNNSLKADFHYRLCQDGINICAPYFSARKLAITLDDFTKLLLEENPKLETLSTALQAQTVDMELGSVCLELDFPYSTQTNDVQADCPTKRHRASDKTLKLNLSAWLARTSVRLFLNKLETLHYAFMIGIEESALKKINETVPPTATGKADQSKEVDADSNGGDENLITTS